LLSVKWPESPATRRRGFAVLLGGPVGAALVDELPVVPDDLLGIDRDLALGGLEVQVPQELRGEVDRQAAVDGLGGEDPRPCRSSQASWGRAAASRRGQAHSAGPPGIGETPPHYGQLREASKR